MIDAPYRNFEDWFGGLEGFHVRSERFYDDLEAGDKQVMLAWLEEAWLLGHECGARSQPQPQTIFESALSDTKKLNLILGSLRRTAAETHCHDLSDPYEYPHHNYEVFEDGEEYGEIEFCRTLLEWVETFDQPRAT